MKAKGMKVKFVSIKEFDRLFMKFKEVEADLINALFMHTVDRKNKIIYMPERRMEDRREV